jgi:hypothetical protein
LSPAPDSDWVLDRPMLYSSMVFTYCEQGGGRTKRETVSRGPR